MQRAAIYHFTNKSDKRPICYKKQIKVLENYAASMGLDVVDIFCDMSLKRYERTEFDRFLSCCDRYDALVTKDFYHISKNTGKCMSVMQELRGHGVQIYTVENGIFSWDNPPFEESLRVATYTCHYGTPNEMKELIPIRNDILTLFARKKTKWTVVDQYFDESLLQANDEQVQIRELIENRDKYNLLLVHNLNDINWKTANFCKVREALHLDIYSMKEGFLKYANNGRR